MLSSVDSTSRETLVFIIGNGNAIFSRKHLYYFVNNIAIFVDSTSRKAFVKIALVFENTKAISI